MYFKHCYIAVKNQMKCLFQNLLLSVNSSNDFYFDETLTDINTFIWCSEQKVS
jgi:hypothetical protein